MTELRADPTVLSLVVFQFGASLVLLVGAGLLIRSFMFILTEDRGFRTDGVVAVTVQSWQDYPQPADRSGFVRAVEDRLAATPGVRAAGTASSVPLMEAIGAEQAPLTIRGRSPLPPGEPPPLVDYVVATSGLFSALAIPLRSGRLLAIPRCPFTASPRCPTWSARRCGSGGSCWRR